MQIKKQKSILLLILIMIVLTGCKNNKSIDKSDEYETDKFKGKPLSIEELSSSDIDKVELCSENTNEIICTIDDSKTIMLLVDEIKSNKLTVIENDIDKLQDGYVFAYYIGDRSCKIKYSGNIIYFNDVAYNVDDADFSIKMNELFMEDIKENETGLYLSLTEKLYHVVNREIQDIDYAKIDKIDYLYSTMLPVATIRDTDDIRAAVNALKEQAVSKDSEHKADDIQSTYYMGFFEGDEVYIMTFTSKYLFWGDESYTFDDEMDFYTRVNDIFAIAN